MNMNQNKSKYSRRLTIRTPVTTNYRYSELSITRIPITRISLKLERFRRPQELPTQAFDSLLLETLYNSNGFQFPVDIRVIESSLYIELKSVPLRFINLYKNARYNELLI